MQSEAVTDEKLTQLVEFEARCAEDNCHFKDFAQYKRDVASALRELQRLRSSAGASVEPADVVSVQALESMEYVARHIKGVGMYDWDIHSNRILKAIRRTAPSPEPSVNPLTTQQRDAIERACDAGLEIVPEPGTKRPTVDDVLAVLRKRAVALPMGWAASPSMGSCPLYNCYTWATDEICTAYSELRDQMDPLSPPISPTLLMASRSELKQELERRSPEPEAEPTSVTLRMASRAELARELAKRSQPLPDQPVVTEPCSVCGGSGLVLNGQGEPDDCRHCTGNTIEPANHCQHGRAFATGCDICGTRSSLTKESKHGPG